jgi:hypothetical protein
LTRKAAHGLVDSPAEALRRELELELKPGVGKRCVRGLHRRAIIGGGAFGDPEPPLSATLQLSLPVVRGSVAPRTETKALLRLVEEIWLVSPTDIRPTYRVPASEVRIQNGLVGEVGVEPTRRLRGDAGHALCVPS